MLSVTSLCRVLARRTRAGQPLRETGAEPREGRTTWRNHLKQVRHGLVHQSQYEPTKAMTSESRDPVGGTGQTGGTHVVGIGGDQAAVAAPAAAPGRGAL